MKSRHRILLQNFGSVNNERLMAYPPQMTASRAHKGQANGDYRGARWMNRGYSNSGDAGDRFRRNQLPNNHPDSPNNDDVGEWPQDFSCISESNS